MKKLLLSAILAFGIVTTANAEVGETHIEDFDFSFEGPFGKFDQYQLQSGLENAPDLSLMAKARAGFHGPNGLGINQIVKGMGGPEYIASVLTGYTGKEKEQAGTTFYENTAFPGGWIAMSPPLSDELVEYADGHNNDTYHIAEDVSAFLMWTAEPKMMARQRLGLISVVMLMVLGVLLYFSNKKLWRDIKRKS